MFCNVYFHNVCHVLRSPKQEAVQVCASASKIGLTRNLRRNYDKMLDGLGMAKEESDFIFLWRCGFFSGFRIIQDSSPGRSTVWQRFASSDRFQFNIAISY